ncbi:MAG TPA: hypothetical protein VJH68_01575 [Candidatus Nanoarchaeia archaeon]|nr:hypothetical protein [Candidatus Nanoarchaeia archaeon]
MKIGSNHRGVINLSVNMIVMIIISLVILAGGIVLLNNLVRGAEDLKEQLDQRTEDQLNELLVSQGQQVALPFNTAAVLRGERHLFGIGILNTGEVGNSFQLSVKFDKLISPEGQEAALQLNPAEWARYERQPLRISEGENVKESILVLVPRDAPSGQYFFKAQVILPTGEAYGNAQRFYVNVK